MNAPNSLLAAELDAALAWWRMSGVDYDYADDATNWLAETAHAPAPKAQENKANPAPTHSETPEAPKIERVDLLGDSPPSDIASFRQFWLEAPGLDAIGPRGRIAPRGPQNADLMVLVIDPEERDSERLLDGPQGRLLTNFLEAAGLDEDAVYIASALPRHTPMADTEAIAASGMDAVTAHHIKLVSPKRVLAFGANISPLLGHALTKDVSSLREINQNPGSIPLMISEGLDSLMTMPRLKARFWRRWIEWSVE